MDLSPAALSLIFVRGATAHRESVGAVLKEYGFDPVASFHLESLDASYASGLINWDEVWQGEGDWSIFVTADYSPRPQDWKQSLSLGPVDNARLRQLPEMQRFLAKRMSHLRNAQSVDASLLATATTEEAYRLLELLRPELVSSVSDTLKRGQAEMEPPYPVIRDMGYYCRYARICLVMYEGREAVCKIYRPGREQYFRNRLLVAERLSHVPEVTPVLESGPNWLVMPYHESARSLKSMPRRAGLLPLSVVRRLAGAVRAIHEAGIAHLDFHPEHVLADPDGTLHIIDFDRIHVYSQLPSIEESVMLAGYEEVMAYDGPTVQWSYDNAWLSLTGMPLSAFVGEDGYRQHIWRFKTRSAKVARRGRSLLRSALEAGKSIAQSARERSLHPLPISRHPISATDTTA